MNACARGAHRVRVRSALPVAIAALLVVLSLAGALGAAGAGAAVRLSPQAGGAGGFWTAARMKQARPLDVDGFGHAKVAADSPAVPSAETPRWYPPLVPSGEASASSAFEEVIDPTEATTRQHGAIFIELPFGLGRCSGTSVNAPNYSVVFTAGHCINSGGRRGRWLARRWLFVPGYRYGQRPFGVFPAKWVDTTRQWLSTGSENFDVGAMVVGRNEHGELLGEAVGGTGIAWGLTARQVFDVHGYPAAPPFNGAVQRVCVQTPFLGHDANSFLAPGPLNLAVDCDVTGGASGGGWTIAGGFLNSVTNYGYGPDPATDFGAYFGKEVGRLFYRAKSVK